ncbi:MAG: 7-carboxy-7-deazaguanine synthase, partial [Geminicoccaceae bacterium]|nr:7-carboxy-7-deazaguanine synthase [Geminicoccaceae bacterium]
MPAGEPGSQPYVVCTGGEPLLQLDAAAIEALHAAGFEVGVETNGTIAAPPGIDWLCVSPKGSAPLVQTS